MRHSTDCPGHGHAHEDHDEEHDDLDEAHEDEHGEEGNPFLDLEQTRVDLGRRH